MKYQLYSAPIRRHLDLRAVCLEATADTLEELKSKGAWKYQPSIITDENRIVIEDNRLDPADVPSCGYSDDKTTDSAVTQSDS